MKEHRILKGVLDRMETIDLGVRSGSGLTGCAP